MRTVGETRHAAHLLALGATMRDIAEDPTTLADRGRLLAQAARAYFDLSGELARVDKTRREFMGLSELVRHAHATMRQRLEDYEDGE